MVALGWPKRREKTTSLMRGSRLISSRMTSSVRSGEGSRQKMISYDPPRFFRTDSMRSRKGAMLASSL